MGAPSKDLCYFSGANKVNVGFYSTSKAIDDFMQKSLDEYMRYQSIELMKHSGVTYGIRGTTSRKPRFRSWYMKERRPKQRLRIKAY